MPPATLASDKEADRAFRITAIRVVAACVAVALLIGLSGAAHDWMDVVQWCVDSAIGAILGLAVARWWVPLAWFYEKLWAAALMIAVSVSVPLTLVIVGWLVLARHAPASLALVASVLPSAFASSLVMTALAFLVRRQATQTHAASPSAPPPKFLARLPAKLQGGELYAVEAEDHYLRLHTSLGQDLILLRLADAIAELEGLEGAQTHRSWWVAKAAVSAVERGDGRATLTLKDGAEVPVSRGFARQLRAAGWF
ncbi:MAG TPA: LytTR family DNA-binding domain-containing protein [Caulobacteraceae bacterium]|nr:LytTR family DNA-binding domain-containing protein [Caulobacteraceae bacterium]